MDKRKRENKRGQIEIKCDYCDKWFDYNDLPEELKETERYACPDCWNNDDMGDMLEKIKQVFPVADKTPAQWTKNQRSNIYYIEPNYNANANSLDKIDNEVVNIEEKDDGGIILRWDNSSDQFAEEVFNTAEELLQELETRFSSIFGG